MSVLFGLLMSFLANNVSKIFLHASFKIAITVAAIAAFVAAVYAYVSAYSVIVNSIAQTVPEIVNGVWGWVMPSNTGICFFSLASCIMLRFITRLYFTVMNKKFLAAISN